MPFEDCLIIGRRWRAVYSRKECRAITTHQRQQSIKDNQKVAPHNLPPNEYGFFVAGRAVEPVHRLSRIPASLTSAEGPGFALEATHSYFIPGRACISITSMDDCGICKWGWPSNDFAAAS